MERVLTLLANAVLVVTCLLATVDTHLLVYPSLSRYLLLEVGIAAFSLIVVCGLVARRDSIAFSRYEPFFVLWMAYVALHGLVSHPCELYRTYYLCATLFLVVTLAAAQGCGLVGRGGMEAGLLLAASIHVACIAGQWLGIMESGNKYFAVTGCGENPTVAALLLVGCLPMMAARTGRGPCRAAYAVLLACAVLGIVLLRCRTAYVGLAVEAAVLAAMKFRPSFATFAARPLRTGSLAVGLLLLTAVSGLGLYQMKKDSADGRLLIWKLSAEMMAERPQGHGYGLFEKVYNLRQASYLAGSDATDTEKRNADFVLMAYNDYLEQGVEGGVVGMALLLLFYVLMVRRSALSGHGEATAVFCAFAVMSLSNFVYTSILPWLLLMCYASVVVSRADGLAAWRCRPRYAALAILAPTVVMACGTLRMTYAQLLLRRLDGAVVADGEYAALADGIGTSEAYWTRRALNDMRAERFDEAIGHIRQARLYSSSPALFVAEYQCLARIGEAAAGMARLDTLSDMIPRKPAIQQYINRQRNYE